MLQSFPYFDGARAIKELTSLRRSVLEPYGSLDVEDVLPLKKKKKKKTRILHVMHMHNLSVGQVLVNTFVFICFASQSDVEKLVRLLSFIHVDDDLFLFAFSLVGEGGEDRICPFAPPPPPPQLR